MNVHSLIVLKVLLPPGSVGRYEQIVNMISYLLEVSVLYASSFLWTVVPKQSHHHSTCNSF